MENNTTMRNFDDNFNIDLPAEIEDLTDENCGWEPVELDDDPDVYTLDDPDFEDDSWNDADSLNSCGWGEDEAYSLFDDGGEW